MPVLRELRHHVRPMEGACRVPPLLRLHAGCGVHEAISGRIWARRDALAPRLLSPLASHADGTGVKDGKCVECEVEGCSSCSEDATKCSSW